MLGMAMDDRKIGLVIEPAANYIESFRERGREHVTLEDLLHMTSGLGPNAPDARPLREASALRGMPLDVVAFDEPAVATLYERRLVLVRPDGHVAWRGDTLPPDPLAVVDAVRGAVNAAPVVAAAQPLGAAAGSA